MGKGLTTDIVGKDSPPVSKYTSHLKTISHNDSRISSFGKEHRFPTYFKSETNEAPHSYLHQDFSNENMLGANDEQPTSQVSLKPKLAPGGQFPSSVRFNYALEDRQRTVHSPGPATYEAPSDFKKNVRTTSLGFGVGKKLDGKVIQFKGMGRVAYGSHSPGPGVYQPEKRSIYSKVYGHINPLPKK